jgi:hypothetical protein
MKKLQSKKTNIFLSFNEAREFVRKLGFKKWDEWNEWSKSGKRPLYIHSTPNRFYKNKGFYV